MHCTNINHPQIQEWSKRFNITPDKIGGLISLWQENNNNLEELPSLLWLENQINSLNTSTEIKQEVNEIFEQNPELANTVYEALGFKDTSELFIIQEEGQKLQRWGNTNYFKEDPSDAWGKSSLRDSLQDVNVNDLITYEKPSEERLTKMGEYKSPEYNQYSTGFPIAIKLNNKIILLDGHHRLELAKRNGQKTIKIAVKDITDKYQQITPQQKQQATFMFSEFLDVYLQDFNQVEKILKEENIIEKDCTGRGKLKAEKGLQTSFTKNGKWKMIKDLKGYPTHKEGGVDLTISRNGVSIKNGNTEFTAKHGLLIPKN